MSQTLRLRSRHEALGARWTEYQGWEIPGSYGDARKEWERVRRTVGLLDLSYRGVLRIVGRDRRTWLHGMVTNDVIGMADGRGAAAALLNVQGHMLSDARVYAVPDALLLELPAATRERMAETLDRYLMMEKVEIEDASEEIGILSVQGPGAAAVAAAFGVDGQEMEPLAIRPVRVGDAQAWIACVDRTGEAGFDLWVGAEQLPAAWDRLLEQVQDAGGGAVGLDAQNVLRVEAGIPWWGAELTEAIVPFEARLESAISLTKGCYIGQEIIARIVARGQVNNLMVGLNYVEVEPPVPGTTIVVGGKTVGRTATAVRSPALDLTIGLGFIRREHAAPGTRVAILLSGEERPTTVSELPFVKS